jgi:aconitate hydratase
MDLDLYNEPLGTDSTGTDVFLADIWPSSQEIDQVVGQAIAAEMFTDDYADVFAGDELWRSLPTPEGDTFDWEDDSTYVRKPPYFEGMQADPSPVPTSRAPGSSPSSGDSVTTDHISPAGAIKKDSPAGRYLAEHGVKTLDFNSYGSRRGNHEVMIRGPSPTSGCATSWRPGTEGGLTRCFAADGEVTTIYDASVAYAEQGTPLVVLAGKEYGSGSSRDWAAKGTALLGRPRCYRRVLRADPPVEPDRHGRAAAAVPRGQSAKSLGLSGERPRLGGGKRPDGAKHPASQGGRHRRPVLLHPVAVRLRRSRKGRKRRCCGKHLDCYRKGRQAAVHWARSLFCSSSSGTP